MKTITLKNSLAVCAALLTATAAIRAAADQPATAATMERPDNHYTGTVASVEPGEHVLNVKGWMLHKSFNLGDSCTYTLWEKPAATAADLRPGEKVVVSYQNVHGVLIASRVEQKLMRQEGTVKAIDPDQHTMTLQGSAWDRPLQIADGCKIVLRDEKPGTFADIRPGNHVTVIYETPDGKPVARQIAQTSQEFTGSLTAIDLGERTLKAKAFFDSKKFNVANNCAIVINGKTNGRLSDLRPGGKCVFSYDEINGINVVNRIAPAESLPTSQQPVAANTAPVAGN